MKINHFRNSAHRFIRVIEKNQQVTAEFHQKLPAGATGNREAGKRNTDGLKLTVPHGYRTTNCRPFCTDRKPI